MKKIGILKHGTPENVIAYFQYYNNEDGNMAYCKLVDYCDEKNLDSRDHTIDFLSGLEVINSKTKLLKL